MSQPIKTYRDLCDEREKMKSLLVVQRQRVIDDWEQVKDEFEPVRNVFGIMGKFTKGAHNNPLISTGIKLASDVFLKNFILAKAGWMTRIAVPFVVKNYSSHMLTNKGDSFVNRLSKIFKRKRSARVAGPTILSENQ